MDFVPNNDLEKILSLATALIFISYYEGFGLPILEAQSCELPVITSKVSATAEIAGDSAILVNPENPDEVSNEIKRLFTSENLRKELITRGKENLKKFSWQKTALETVKVYQYALN